MLNFIKIFFLFSLFFQCFSAYSGDLKKCRKEFTTIENFNEETALENQRKVIQAIDTVVDAIRYMENPTPQEHPLRNIKIAMMERVGVDGLSSYSNATSVIHHRLIGDYHKMLELMIEAISISSQKHNQMKHNLWNHILKITGQQKITDQQSEILFPSNIDNDVLKLHFDSILNFLIHYLEYGNLHIAINLSAEKNGIRKQGTTTEKVKRIRSLIWWQYRK